MAVVALEFTFDQADDDLSVSLGVQCLSTGDEFGAQCLFVLDDAIVHDGEIAARGQMRVSIRFADPAVGGPARVADAQSRDGGLRGVREQRGARVGDRTDIPLTIHAIEWARRADGVRRIELDVFSTNPPAIRLYEQLGFVTEGRRRSAYVKNGVEIDGLVMALLL